MVAAQSKLGKNAGKKTPINLRTTMADADL